MDCGISQFKKRRYHLKIIIFLLFIHRYIRQDYSNIIIIHRTNQTSRLQNKRRMQLLKIWTPFFNNSWNLIDCTAQLLRIFNILTLWFMRTQKQSEIHRKNTYIHTHYPMSKCSIILRKRQKHSDLAKYLHAAYLGPVKSTFIKAIEKGFFKPGQAYQQN